MTDQRDGLSVAETLADTATDLDRSTHIANSYAPTAPFTDTNGSTYRRASNLTTGQAVLSGASANLLAPALQDRKPTGTKRQHDSGFDAATKNDGPATKRVKATEHEGERDMSHESKAVVSDHEYIGRELLMYCTGTDISYRSFLPQRWLKMRLLPLHIPRYGYLCDQSLLVPPQCPRRESLTKAGTRT